MRIFIFALFLIWAPFAQASEIAPMQSLKVNEIMRGRFVQEHFMEGVQKPLRTEGHFVVAPGRGLIWAVEKPLPMSFVVTPMGMTQFIGNFPLKQRTSSDAGRIMETVMNALSGKWDVLEKDFRLDRAGDRQKWSLKAIPRQGKQAARWFSRLNARGSRFVEDAEVYGNKGSKDLFTFSSQQVLKESLSATEKGMLGGISR